MLTIAASFTKRLFSGLPDDKLKNILLFGLAGSSKSTFINSCYSLLAGETKEIATAGGSDVRVTAEYKSWRLLDFNRKEGADYRLWDTWGLERNNYQKVEFEEILNGLWDTKTKMGEEQKYKLGNLAASSSFNQKNVPLCVMFFIPAAEVKGGPEQLFVQKTKEFMEKATQAQVSCVLVLTKIDTVCPDFIKNPFGDADAKKLLNTAANLFNLSPNKVVALINHTSKDEPSELQFEINRVIFNVLSAAISIADSASLKSTYLSKDIADLIDS